MNYPEFMTAIIEVYGDYTSPALKKITAMYIKEKWQESELENIFKKLILVKTAKFKTPPDPAEFEELFFKKSEKEYEAEALEWWRIINRTGSSYDNIIVSDIRVQAVLRDMGGWGAFCSRNTEDEHWHQQKFIKWFVMYSNHMPEGQPEIIFGDGDRSKPPLLFGDKEKCKLLLTQRKDENLKFVENMMEGMRV